MDNESQENRQQFCETEYLNANETESIINDNKELLKLLTSIINSTKQGMGR